MIKPYSLLYIGFCGAYLWMSFAIYSGVFQQNTQRDYPYETTTSKGRLVWQQYNCHTCHQLYGLGGFLGPDLTNVSQRGKTYLETFLKLGPGAMPSYQLSEEEINLLYDFLAATNASGSAKVKDYRILSYGMIQPNMDHEENKRISKTEE
ncbi:MAG: cytochrome c [Flavobacteriaceae bacterium]|nr:cytochrome c [Flavobacteriaceae bacterium]